MKTPPIILDNLEKKQCYALYELNITQQHRPPLPKPALEIPRSEQSRIQWSMTMPKCKLQMCANH